MNSETDLTTLAAVKQWLPVASNVTSANATLQALISACSGDFMRATNRPDLLQATYDEVRTGDGAYRLGLYHWPIQSITSLTVGGVAIPQSADKIAAGWFIDTDIDPEQVYNLYLNGSRFTDNAPVAVTYVAGYPSVPPDIAQAVADWVAYRYKQLPNLGATQRKVQEGESVQQTQNDAPATALACIQRYMRRLPGVNRRHDEEDLKRAGFAARAGVK